MHSESKNKLKELLEKYEITGSCLDVGSYYVNGSYQKIVEDHGMTYTGLDIRAGRNVDIVADSPYGYPVEARSYDLVASGSTMEHVKMPWIWMQELRRVSRQWVIVITHAHFPKHDHPWDCWRVWEEGMRAVMDWARLEVVEVGEYPQGNGRCAGTDCYGVGRVRT